MTWRVMATAAGGGRIVVTDSFTHCETGVGAADVIVAGSFAGALSFGFVLPRGARGLIAHAAGIGRERAGISGLPLADRCSVPAAAVDTMSARLGEGDSVYADGVVSHVNATAQALGIGPGMGARTAAGLMLGAPAGRPLPEAIAIDRGPHVVEATSAGRIVLLGSTSFATPDNRRDVLGVGSHGGRVNVQPLLPMPPRGVLCFDGGMARDRSGVSGLPLYDEAGIAAAAVDVMSACIGSPQSLWATGVISAVNARAARLGAAVGQAAATAARHLLAAR
jgi:hypothetical protein